MRLLVFGGALSLLLAACGGGGSSPPSVAVAPATSIKPFPTSYENAKKYGLSRIAFPPSVNPTAWGAGDFFQRGSIDLFTTKINHNLSSSYATVTSDPKYLSDFQFWKRQSDNSLSLVATYKGCLLPRKAVVADFNQDGYPDVFVACHGYDALVNGSFPGEKSKLVLSDGKGGFTVTDATDVGYYHGASAADVNGDGYPDIVVANIMNPGSLNVHFLMNQRDGTFKIDNTRVPGQVGTPFFSVELLDVNGDGIVDLVVGGQESNGSSAETAVLFGNPQGVFGAAKTVIPKVAGRGVVLDFTVVTNNGQKTLYVGRTADGSSPGVPYYSTQTLQAINLATNASTTLLDQPASQLGSWIAWWLPVTRDGHNGVAPFNASSPDFFYWQ